VRNVGKVTVGMGLVTLFWASAAGAEATSGDPGVVLPGFAPLAVSGTAVAPEGRVYAWDRSLLPVRIESRGKPLVGAFRLRLRRDGAEVSVPVGSVEAAGTPAAATVRAEGAAPDLAFTTVSRVEYDGVAMVELTITPARPVTVDSLDLEIEVLGGPSLKMLAFGERDFRFQKRPVDVEPRYRGDLLYAVGLADGERSFWWFVDDARGWVLNGDSETEVEPLGDRVRLRQRLVASRTRLAEPVRIAFNFLATPVRPLGTAWRKELRVTPRLDREGAALGSFQLWWVDAFPHKILPYAKLPEDAAAAIPASDRAVFRGPDGVRRDLDRARALGIHRLPYFSAHMLSVLDPGLRMHRGEWEVTPPFVAHVVDPPFGKVETPTLSHRARGYGDHVIARLAPLIDELGFDGLYLDQGDVMDSRNPLHDAGWRDTRGRLRPSLDILGTRDFLRRLRVLFHEKGKPGWLFVHNSNCEMVPAYTFVTSTVDGEQFARPLPQEDYIGALSLDRVRTQMAPEQYGIVTTWLPQFFAWHPRDPGWNGRPAGRRAFRNFATLALLHDIPTWPAGVESEHRRLLESLDAFGIERAEFTGYWAPDAGARAGTDDAAVSYYRRANDSAVLLVVANLAKSERTLSVGVDLDRLGLSPDATWKIDGRPAEKLAGGAIAVPVPGRDHALVELRNARR
jgi:hypothetical protein